MVERLKYADWLDIGLALLAQAGPDALTIDGVSARANRSKGSFYHHFETIDAYLLALAEAWREKHTEAVIRRAENAATPEGKLDALNVLTSVVDQRVEQGFRALATRNPAIADLCHAVDQRRTQFLARLHADAGVPLESALMLARIEYAAFLGLAITEPRSTPEERQALYRRFIAFLRR